MKTTDITRNDEGRIVAVNDADNPYVQSWLKRMRELDPGEVITVHLDKSASHPLTAWHIILCKAVFAEQEVFTDFKAFRQFLYTMSGHCVEVTVGRKTMRMPGSWSWDDLPNDYERSEVHNKVVLTMHDPLILRTLWPHLKPGKRMEMLLDTIARAEAEREVRRAQKARRQAARNQPLRIAA